MFKLKVLMEGVFENGFSLIGFSVYSILRLFNKLVNYFLSSEVLKVFVVEGGYINNYNNVNNCNVKIIFDFRRDLFFMIRRKVKLFFYFILVKNLLIICIFFDLKICFFFFIIFDIFFVDMWCN